MDETHDPSPVVKLIGEHAISLLAPDWTSASLACFELGARPERARQVWRALRKIIDADTFLHAREQELVAEVQSALRVA